MSIVLDGTTGITTPAETVSGTGVWSVGGTQIYKDSSGNVVLNNSSPIGGGKLSLLADTSTANGFVIKDSATTYANNNNFLLLYNSSGSVAGALTHPAVQSLGVWGRDDIRFVTGNLATEQMRLDSSGNLGLGVTPSAWTTGVKAIELQNGAALVSFSNATQIASNAVNVGGSWQYKTNSLASLYNVSQGYHYWYNAPSGTAGNAIPFTQAMTLDASGNLLVGTTSNPNSAKIAVGPTSSNGISIESSSTSVVMSQLLFRNPNGLVGSVTTAGSATNYNTSSDYRLKENIAPMTGALAVVEQLKPCTYIWKSDGSEGQGFIAHELAEVVPDCVTGAKDAVDEEGNPVYQGIDTSFLVATLTAAIKEQQAIIQTLTSRIEALEGAAQ